MTGQLFITQTSPAGQLRLTHRTDEGRLHRGGDPVDNGDACSCAPGRGGTGRIIRHHRVFLVPVVRRPDVTSWVNRHLGYHLDAGALELVDHVPCLGTSGMPRRVLTRHQDHAPAIEVAGPNVVPAVDGKAPRDVDRQTAVSMRRRMGAVGTGHLHHAGGFYGRRISEDVQTGDLKLRHDLRARGDNGRGEVQIDETRRPDIALGVQGDTADANPTCIDGLRLRRIFGREPDDSVGQGIAHPHAILGIDDNAERGSQPLDLYDPSVLYASAGEVKQLVFHGIRDPHITVRGNANALQAAVLARCGKVAFLADRISVEIHHANLAVEARDPDFVGRHAGAPADAVHAHASEAGNRWRERGPVGCEFDRAPTDAVNNTGLRSGQPVLTAP